MGLTISTQESGLNCRLVAKLSCAHHLQYVNFMLEAKNATNEAMNRCVRNFDAAMYVSSVDLYFRLTMQEFSMVGSYMEDLTKTPKNHQN